MTLTMRPTGGQPSGIRRTRNGRAYATGTTAQVPELLPLTLKEKSLVRQIITRLARYMASPFAFLILFGYGALWWLYKPGTLR